MYEGLQAPSQYVLECASENFPLLQTKNKSDTKISCIVRLKQNHVQRGRLKTMEELSALSKRSDRSVVKEIIVPRLPKFQMDTSQRLGFLFFRAFFQVRQLERNWAMEQRAKANKLETSHSNRMLRSPSAYNKGFLFVDTSDSEWRILHMNPEASEKLGAAADALLRFCMCTPVSLSCPGSDGGLLLLVVLEKAILR